jgi:hypothetical protein
MKHEEINGKAHDNFSEISDQGADEIIKQFDENTQALLEMISSFDQEEFNTVPFEGSWTPGQVVEHLMKSESGVAEMLATSVEATERNPGEKIGEIKDTFLDFTIKFQSPKFIIPDNEPKDKRILFKAMKHNREKIQKAIKSMDMSQTCLSFELPVMGFLTRLEWIHFLMYHSQRHIHQLKNIYKVLHDEH